MIEGDNFPGEFDPTSHIGDEERTRIYRVGLSFEVVSAVHRTISNGLEWAERFRREVKKDEPLVLIDDKLHQALISYKPRFFGKGKVNVYLSFSNINELGLAGIRMFYRSASLQGVLDELDQKLSVPLFGIVTEGVQIFPSFFEDLPRRLSMDYARDFLIINKAFVRAGGHNNPKLREIFETMIRSNR